MHIDIQYVKVSVAGLFPSVSLYSSGPGSWKAD